MIIADLSIFYRKSFYWNLTYILRESSLFLIFNEISWKLREIKTLLNNNIKSANIPCLGTERLEQPWQNPKANKIFPIVTLQDQVCIDNSDISLYTSRLTACPYLQHTLSFNLNKGIRNLFNFFIHIFFLNIT